MPGKLSELAAMQEAQKWAFLEQAKQIRISTQASPDGPAFVSAHWFVCDDETLYVTLDPEAPFMSDSPASRQIEGLKGSGRFAAVVDEGDELTNRRSVHLSGAAELVSDEGRREELLDLALEKYFYVSHPHLEAYMNRGSVMARQWWELTAEEIEDWDLRMLPFPQSVERRLLATGQ